MNNKKTIEISALVAICAFAVLTVLSIIYGQFHVADEIKIGFLIALIYVIWTKRIYLVLPIVSLIVFMSVLVAIPQMFLFVTKSNPLLLATLIIIVYLATLYLSTIKRHAEWSIRSSWVANIIACIVIAIFTQAFMMSFQITTPAMGMIFSLGTAVVYMVITVVYLMFTPGTRVHKPSSKGTAEYKERLIDSVKNFYEINEDKKGNITVNDDYSYRLFFTQDEIVYNSDEKPRKAWTIYNSGKSTKLYPWLLQQSSYSYENTKKGKKQIFILVEVGNEAQGATKSTISYVKRPRSRNQIGFVRLSINQFDEDYLSAFNEAASKAIASRETKNKAPLPKRHFFGL